MPVKYDTSLALWRTKVTIFSVAFVSIYPLSTLQIVFEAAEAAFILLESFLPVMVQVTHVYT